MTPQEEIKSKLDIVELIREYIPVKAAGVNFQALCPFHNEKTPSFTISPDKQVWHCFGCSKGGDIFSFIMEKENMTFPEALRFLASKAGVVLKNDDAENYTKRNRLLDILELAAKYYEHCLKSESGKKIREYLATRGLNEEVVKEWRIGYSPDSWSSLYDFLKARPLTGKKFTDEEIFSAGLSIKKEQYSSSRAYYDRFRDRVMFPIWDASGNIIAFTARINPDKEKILKAGKYVNSPQTELYDKSRILFALNKAKNEIKKQDLAIIVEGQMDAIACHNHGIKNVVASSGTALTVLQINLLKRFSNKFALVFDMDAAGQMAADRGIRECLAEGIDVKIITLPSGKDPDESLRNDPSEMERSAIVAARSDKDNFEDYYRKPIENAKSILEYYFDKVSTGLDLHELDVKKIVRDKMLEMISLIKDKTEQGYWLKKISDDLEFSESDMREEFLKRYRNVSDNNSVSSFNRVIKEKKISEELLNNKESVKNREERLSESFLAILLRAPEFIPYAVNNLEPNVLCGENLVLFYNNLIIYYNKTGKADYDGFGVFLIKENFKAETTLRHLALLGEKDFYDFDSSQMKTQLVDIISELKACRRKHLLEQVRKEISEAERRGDEESLKSLMEDLKKIMEQK
jgi:DNA primase